MPLQLGLQSPTPSATSQPAAWPQTACLGRAAGAAPVLGMKALTDALGVYEPPGAGLGNAITSYARPGRSGVLWERFTREKEAALAARKAAETALRDRHLEHLARLREFYDRRFRREQLIGPRAASCVVRASASWPSNAARAMRSGRRRRIGAGYARCTRCRAGRDGWRPRQRKGTPRQLRPWRVGRRKQGRKQVRDQAPRPVPTRAPRQREAERDDGLGL